MIHTCDGKPWRQKQNSEDFNVLKWSNYLFLSEKDTEEYIQNVTCSARREVRKYFYMYGFAHSYKRNSKDDLETYENDYSGYNVEVTRR